MNDLLSRLVNGQSLSLDEWEALISCTMDDSELFALARKARDEIYGRKVFLRGLIEFTSFCRNDCYYCGIRHSNKHAERYRLEEKEIIECCIAGYEAGFRSFVLQGGEDLYFTDERMVSIIRAIKEKMPDSALTVSIGERTEESYRLMKEAGADRYLLRHETADREHYSILHPASLSFDDRIKCLENLKKLGYQTGAGMMVGSPGSSFRTLAEDMLFIESLKPEMVGIGPFIPHHDTPFAHCRMGSVSLTLRMIALVRLLDPHIMLPSTTALGTADSNGTIKGLEAGANVIMPNITPIGERRKYTLYDNKKITGSEAGENIAALSSLLESCGYEASLTRGDCIRQ